MGCRTKPLAPKDGHQRTRPAFRGDFRGNADIRSARNTARRASGKPALCKLGRKLAKRSEFRPAAIELLADARARKEQRK